MGGWVALLASSYSWNTLLASLSSQLTFLGAALLQFPIMLGQAPFNSWFQELTDECTSVEARKEIMEMGQIN